MERIIVATDNGAIREELRTALEFEGHSVTEAATVSETIAEACSGRHDLLMTDAAMDGPPAYALWREIRSKSKLGSIVLGEENEAGAVDALNAGAGEYVRAPFVMPEAAARVVEPIPCFLFV